ncbi:hypothetical protein B7463_g7708, partial [Scytalidium lignicola]
MHLTTPTNDAQRLSYILLVELLAHQFCFPVKWIDTQDVVLGQFMAERIIEIGPSNTLLNMVKRTLVLKYKTHDAVYSMRRQLLSYTKDAKTIYFEEDSTEEESVVTAEKPPVESQPPPLIIASASPAPPPAAGSLQVTDCAVTAVEIIKTLISHSLKRPVDQVAGSSSIKSLAGGRSTLQNEIIGDLNNEFGSLPESLEDLSIEELGSTIQSSFGGRLGKQSMSLIGKVISSKMPGGFNLAAVRRYLEERWGFAAGRQNSILLLAVAQQPNTRFLGDSDAKSFFDGLVKIHALISGLDLGSKQGATPVSSGAPTVVDSAVLNQLQEDQLQFDRKILELYAKKLDVNINPESTIANGKDELQAELDALTGELGEVYTTGIKPQFTPLKARVYDSYWNWAQQDLLALFYDITNTGTQISDEEVIDRVNQLTNRSSPRLLQSMQYLASQFSKSDDDRHIAAKKFINSLIDKTTDSLNLDPAVLDDSAVSSPQTAIDQNGNIRFFELTDLYLEHLDFASSHGISFTKKSVLITGAGAGSIGEKLVQGLLIGGAQVVVTSSSYSSKVTKHYQNIYTHYGAKGSRLVVLPFNQGSRQDIKNLVDYIYDEKVGLGWDLDHIIPFAAISENGREIDCIDSKSELAHRIMLTNTLRLIGEVKRRKSERNIRTRPAQVILPLSPNHGTFGNDGLYSESKLGLEALFNKWYSESWGEYLSICGVTIGWTRGTGLMSDNDIVCEGIEKLGVRTFSQSNMAFNILGLMTSSLLCACQLEPLFADLSGGMETIPNLKEVTSRLRKEIVETSRTQKAVLEETLIDSQVEGKNVHEAVPKPPIITRRANIKLDFPQLPDHEEIERLKKDLLGMVDLESVVVIAGFSEIGPYGNSRTRWEMEAFGKFSLEGCIQLAWMMGLIKHNNAKFNGKEYPGWIDVESGNPITDMEVKSKYEAHILAHTGIRVIEPKVLDGANPNKKLFLHEVVIQHDLEPFETTKETALDFEREHGDKVDITEIPESGEYYVKIKKGATLMIPKALGFNHAVGGQIPTGWDPRVYGISDDIISQVDVTALYALICTVEAFLAAGITDVYELYNYIHVSELGNCVGSGIGGMTALQKMFKQRFMDKPVQKDILAETFISTIGAWVNMLLLSSSGPTSSPVGACATAIESLDVACNMISNGKAKACLVGGVDDLTQDISYEFANMKATINATDDFARGRDAKEMSRPATTTRNGFVEAEGAGIQLITTAKLALDMGLPIYGIVALTQTAMDKISRSVPAPGKGILTIVREAPSQYPAPILNLKYRKRNLDLRLSQIDESKKDELRYLHEEVGKFKNSSQRNLQLVEYEGQRKRNIELEADRQRREALRIYGNQFWHGDHRISPLRGALAVWGLTIDDLGVASFHGTSTKLSEKNESELIHRELAQLGRTAGNEILCIFQKHLTGHPKGAAGAWMINGGLQTLSTGLVPGNSNADNIDSTLRQFSHLIFPSRTLKTNGIKAFSVTSFGFGQKGGQAIIVHPMYLFATIDEQTYHVYKQKRQARQIKGERHYVNALMTNSLCVVKERPPYGDGEAGLNFIMNPNARVETKSYGRKTVMVNSYGRTGTLRVPIVAYSGSLP